MSSVAASSTSLASNLSESSNTNHNAVHHKRLTPQQTEEQERKKRKLLHEMKGKELRYLTRDEDGTAFEELLRNSYRGFIYHSAQQFTDEFPSSAAAALPRAPAPSSDSSAIPASTDFHSRLRDSCLMVLLRHGYFFRDVIQVGGNDAGDPTKQLLAHPPNYHYVRTRVQRCLVGEAGMTYRYSGVRLFAHPWNWAAEKQTEGRSSESSTSTHRPPQVVVEALRLLHVLNEYMQTVAQRSLQTTYTLPTDAEQARDPRGAEFNLALLNFLDPRTHAIPLQTEKYYKMGKSAIGWHRDESLEPLSTIGVYHSSEERDIDRREKNANEFWHIALKRLWDIETPAIKFPLHSGDAYFMAYDLNTTHQHAVMAGTRKRFSSTHRRAISDRQTFQYIDHRCDDILEKLKPMQSPNDITVDLTRELLAASDEVEFEWIRQFYLQGARHAKKHDYFWKQRVDALQEKWKRMQQHITWIYQQLANYKFSPSPTTNDASTSSGNSSSVPADKKDVAICKLLLEGFAVTNMLRQTWTSRYRQKAYYPTEAQRDEQYVEEGEESDSKEATIHAADDSDVISREDEPIVRPEFSDESLLPHDLSSVLSNLSQWLPEFEAMH